MSKVDKEKPEGLAKGKLVDVMGTCRYCGQRSMTKADPTATQADINELVTLQCNCDEAFQYQRMNQQIALNEEGINKMFGAAKYPEDVREFLRQALKIVASSSADSVRVVLWDDTVATVKIQKGKLNIERKRVDIDNTNIDLGEEDE